MALAAGRVGVSPQDVDSRGHINAGGLSPEQSSKLDRALVSPITAPLENEMVGIGTGNDQIMIKLGKGVKLSGATSPYTITLNPEPTAADAGKVLTVTNDGGLEWHKAGGGGVYVCPEDDTLYIATGCKVENGVLKTSGGTRSIHVYPLPDELIFKADKKYVLAISGGTVSSRYGGGFFDTVSEQSQDSAVGGTTDYGVSLVKGSYVTNVGALVGTANYYVTAQGANDEQSGTTLYIMEV